MEREELHRPMVWLPLNDDTNVQGRQIQNHFIDRAWKGKTEMKMSYKISNERKMKEKNTKSSF